MTIVQRLKDLAWRFNSSRAHAWLEQFTGGEVHAYICDDSEDRMHRGWPAFRAFLTLHPRWHRGPLTLQYGFACRTGLYGLYPLRISDGNVSTGMACGFHTSFSIESYPLCNKLGARLGIPKYKQRALTLTFHDAAVWWRLWADDMGWSRKTPRWRDGCWKPLDTFLGREKYTSTTVEQAEVVVPMPEKGYAVKVDLRRDVWKRPRWPFEHVIMRAHVDAKEPIPVPGKGENSYDCGQDAIYGSTFPASSVIDAIVQLRNDALETRKKYGGENWKPREVVPS